MTGDPATRFRENVTEITATVVTGVWLALLFLPFGGNLWLPAMLVGYIVVVPLVALLYGDEEDRREWWNDEETETESTSEDPLETLRERYARGELTDAEFERRLERLLGTESPEDAERWRRDARDDRNRRTPNDRGRSVERDERGRNRPGDDRDRSVERDDRDRDPEYER